MKEKWLQKFSLKCNEHGWLFLSSHNCQIPKLCRRAIQIICRIRTISSPFFYKTFYCSCGSQISLHHLISDCDKLPPEFEKVKNLKNKHCLQTSEFVQLHKNLGTTPMKTLTNAIMASDLNKYF